LKPEKIILFALKWYIILNGKLADREVEKD